MSIMRLAEPQKLKNENSLLFLQANCTIISRMFNQNLQAFRISLQKFWRQWVLGAFLPVYLFTTFFGTLARVDGDSMAPTLKNGHAIVLMKYPRWLHTWNLSKPYLKRGDLMVFKIPSESPYAFSSRFGIQFRPYNIKRVVALAGDTVEIREGELYVNGQKQDERYISSEGYMNAMAPLIVPPQTVWVLGDNRRSGSSLDSRAYGPVKLRDVAGLVNWRLFPNTGLITQDHKRIGYIMNKKP